MKAKLFGVGLLIVMTGCALDGPVTSESLELTEHHGCGFGFYLGNSDQTAGLFVTLTDFETGLGGNVPESASLSGDFWQAELRFGADLFANWCDDVLEPGEPTPDVGQTWDVTGAIDVTALPPAGQCGPAGARLTGLEAQRPDGEALELGDFEMENEFWGCFAG